MSIKIKIDIVRFFSTKLARHGKDWWLEHDTNHAIDAGGASFTGVTRMIAAELGGKGGSGRPTVDPLATPSKPKSFHESLDFEETAEVGQVAYVFTLPKAKSIRAAGGEAGVLHHDDDLRFLGSVAEPTRFHPRATNPFVTRGKVLREGKSAWIVLDRARLRKSSVAKAVRAQEAGHMVVPVGFDIYDHAIGLSSWVLPHGKTEAYLRDGLKMLWHGGPHPPENTSITVKL
ncbi:hypothetical protein J4558_10375 [Leptolyngbya sp. 15MV]|nr:hypothetical protein J4558_10375 [Leptolyngbya sp. 15MV]